jgi:glycosyltransferase involved in cell wall biosynthesis
MSIPSSRHIRYLGHVPEADKAGAMAAATLFINPSSFESFSIVTLEAMLCGTPVLVNGECEVLKGHIARSCAGLYYEGPTEFSEALRLLIENPAMRHRMGTNGQKYVVRNYDTHLVRERYIRFLEASGSSAVGA